MTNELHAPNVFVSPGECYQCGTNHAAAGRPFVMVGYPNEFIDQVSICAVCLVGLAVETKLCVTTDKYQALSDEAVTVNERNNELNEVLEGLSDYVATVVGNIASSSSVLSALPADLHVVEDPEEPDEPDALDDSDELKLFNLLELASPGDSEGV